MTATYDRTPRLGLPLMNDFSGQKMAHIIYNEAMAICDVFMVGHVLGVANSPSGSPVDGDAWIVDTSPSGDFADFDRSDVVYYFNGTWYALAPIEGWSFWVDDEDQYRTFTGAAWATGPT